MTVFAEQKPPEGLRTVEPDLKWQFLQKKAPGGPAHSRTGLKMIIFAEKKTRRAYAKSNRT